MTTSKHDIEIYDVVIAGYGPVGATLANLLVQQGLSVAIVEREASVYHLARAGHFDAEIMRVFQSIGVAQDFEPKCGITTGMRFLDADGALLMEWKRGGAKGPLGWVSDYMFHQPDLELDLRDKLNHSKLAKSFLQHDIYAIEEGSDHVVVKAEDTAQGRLVELKGRYVVGCDGARSLARRIIGSEHEDLGFKQRWLVVDVQSNRDLGLEPVSTQHCNPERPMFASSTSAGRLRWEIMVKPADDIALMIREKNIWDLIENSVRPISRNDGEITRAVVYTFESLITLNWRKGRILLAGDSAHRTPPFLGQGMCAGIRDAANLAWKLAAVCKGRANEELLDTYAPERIPHVRAFIQGAVDAGRLIQMTDPVEIRERTQDMRANPKAYAPPNPHLGPGMSVKYGQDGLGRQFVQPHLEGKLLDDYLGHNFALIASEEFIRAATNLPELKGKYSQLKVVALPPTLAHTLEPYAAPAILIRPDRYVHAVITDSEALASTLHSIPVDLT